MSSATPGHDDQPHWTVDADGDLAWPSLHADDGHFYLMGGDVGSLLWDHNRDEAHRAIAALVRAVRDAAEVQTLRDQVATLTTLAQDAEANPGDTTRLYALYNALGIPRHTTSTPTNVNETP